MTRSPHIKRMILPEHIPPELVPSWHEFLATLPPAWWEGKTAKMSHDNNKIRRVGNVLYTKGKNLSYL